MVRRVEGFLTIKLFNKAVLQGHMRNEILYNLHYQRFMSTKFGRMITYLDGILNIKSHDPFGSLIIINLTIIVIWHVSHTEKLSPRALDISQKGQGFAWLFVLSNISLNFIPIRLPFSVYIMVV